MTDTRTLRERLETWRDRHRDWRPSGAYSDHVCLSCEQYWPCVDYRDAVAALALLDASGRTRARDTNGRRYRLVPDAEPAPPPSALRFGSWSTLDADLAPDSSLD